MPKLLDQVRGRLRTLHYSIRTEDAYVQWVRRFILFHGKRHPAEMGEPEVQEFLTWLAVERNVAASTQNQALSALLFLYKVVLDRPLEQRIDAVRARRPEGGKPGVTSYFGLPRRVAVVLSSGPRLRAADPWS